jgi:aspartyl-tRNA(Asn)/glutamyl-tRNA(Gln) amidotransferase subunit C
MDLMALRADRRTPNAARSHGYTIVAVPAAFTPDDLKNLARLARLDLTPGELTLFARQLSDFLAYADQVQQIDTAGVPPTSHPTASTASLREDEPQGSLARADVLAQAPEADVAAGLFKVPRVLGS